ncbi:electron transport complex subunit E [Natroniella acetigena]|uniref:electron transport complex subunit RsxE n=1 Tax=Natroniella acetigena TaxID=52004 RepID=UPI00200A5884|nr:electron transport complex subunit E [Natroniella acetigena]MCK8827877.1 electron transport complex subunit E [Natroniella acetigena]
MAEKTQDFVKGLWEENPVFVMLLGMCPVLAVTSTATNGLFMGLATSFVLLGAGIVNSLLQNIIPDEVRIPSFIVVIATFVTIVDLVSRAYMPAIAEQLALFIPLIIVNCLILNRSEAFASNVNVLRAIIDALGRGLGFTWALTFLGGIREILGFGTLFRGTGAVIQVLGEWYQPMLIAILPAGAFITLGLVVGLVNVIMSKSFSIKELFGGSSAVKEEQTTA